MSNIPWPAIVAIVAIVVIVASYVLFAPASKLNLKPGENIVVITGCDSGFGLMLAKRLAKMGFHVIAACLTKEGVENLKNTVSLAVQCDVTKEADLKTLASATEAHSKKINARLWALVNNAGIAPTGCIDWLSMATHRKTFEVNYFAIVYLVQCMLHMLKQTKYSRIICLSSTAGILGFSSGTAYCGSKHAVEGMTKCLRQELKAWNIFVCNVSPGFMRSATILMLWVDKYLGRTPIITNGKTLAWSEFEKAPKEIREQYDHLRLKAMEPVIDKMAEDPELVINQLVDLVISANPSLFNAVGVQALLARMSMFVPQRLNAFFEDILFTRLYNPVKPESVTRIQINQ